MAKLSIHAGATSQSINIFIQDSSSTIGAGLSGLAPANGSLGAGVTAYYSFAGASAASVAISLSVPATVGASYSSGQIVEIDATHMKGVYRLDLPNGTVASGNGRSVFVFLYGGTNMAPCPVEIELTGIDNQDAVHFGMSAIPNTAVTTNASLLTSGTSTDQISVSAGKVLLQATQSGVTIPTVTTVTNQLTAAQVATGIWQDTTSGDFTVASSIGKSLYTTGATPGATGGLFIAGTNAATTVTTSFTTTFTGNLTGNVGGNVTGSVGSVVGNTNQTGDTYALANGSSGFVATKSAIAALQTTANTINVNTASIPTTAQIATAIWTDTTGSDFSTASSPGKIIVTQLGGAFTTTASSIFSTASLANGPTGSAPTAAQVATAVWQDSTAGDFTTAGSIGKGLFTGGVVPGGSGGLFIAGTNAATVVTTSFTTTFTGNLTGSVASVTSKTGFILASNGLDSITIEAGINARQASALTMDAVCSILAGAGTTTVTVFNPAASANRIVATIDGSQNRTAVVLTPPA